MEKFLFKEIIEHTTDAVLVTKVHSMNPPYGPKIVYVNDAYVQMTGYAKEEVIGKTPRILQGPETDRRELDKLRYAIKNQQPGRAEVINYKKNGEKFWTSISISPIFDTDGHCTHWIGIKRDITSQKHQQQVLNESLREKETLLSEVHHRVKNNLAVITSLMQLQAFNELDGKVRDKLLNCINRIQSIANIHEHIYKSNSFSHVNFDAVLKPLVTSIVDTFQAPAEITLNFDTEGVTLNVNQAIPAALILNEVISNIIHHAFHGKSDGTITVETRKNGRQIFLLAIDNGANLPASFDPHNSNTLGLQLINVLTKQLKGNYQYKSEDSRSVFELAFEKSDERGIANSLTGGSLALKEIPQSIMKET
ncbi:MAG TPA: histidine kinase dimerization/phosphoacceptor domain -containing protein [Balneolaceae bacterium]|nr:histidine kinase dimerization/phosphoacceptor domain -containing protein [Balneolaceae bacterium]